MLLRALVALVLLGGVAAADATPPRGAEAACVASLTAARDWAARLDSALDKLQVRVEGKRTVVYGGECGRVEVDVHTDEHGRADRPWRASKHAKRPVLLDAGANLCGEQHVEERAHDGFVASLMTRAVPGAIVERFKRAVDECVNAAARPKSAPRPDRRAARP